MVDASALWPVLERQCPSLGVAPGCRVRFLAEQPEEGKRIRAKERKRRQKKYGKDVQIVLFGELPGESGLDAGEADDEPEAPEAEPEEVD